MNWLDTETQEILQKAHEWKPVGSKAVEFGLVLLRKGTDEARLVRAICRINDCPELEAVQLARLPTPVTIDPGLTEAEAVFGQFELICCDAIAAFIRSEVLLEHAQKDYLDQLFQRILQSREFALTRIDVIQVPATEAGENFVDQFIGNPLPGEQRPFDEFSLWVPYKKARIMKHWAARIGAEVYCQALKDEARS